MTHGSLFSGIGGFDIAAEWAGWDNLFHCEWNPFGQRVLKHYWPQSTSYDDITKTDFTIWNGRIDVLTGGFPCQPYSLAGKRKGKEDERHLWPEMLRAIREIQPPYVVGENVFGLINWNGGLVFDEVQADLEAEGYEVWPYVLPACAVNAPHRRDRVWFVAYWHGTGLQEARTEQQTTRLKQHGKLGLAIASPDSNGLNQRNSQHEVEPSKRGVNALGDVGSGDRDGVTSNPNNTRNTALRSEHNPNGAQACQEREQSQLEHNGLGDTWTASNTISGGGRQDERWRNGKPNERNEVDETRAWSNFPTQPPICGGDDGLPTELDGITFSKWRNESIKAYGNAIVPQVAYQIFKSINLFKSP
jgi:DNA (cytosine-5)-methyltransferase 1